MDHALDAIVPLSALVERARNTSAMGEMKLRKACFRSFILEVSSGGSANFATIRISLFHLTVKIQIKYLATVHYLDASLK